MSSEPDKIDKNTPGLLVLCGATRKKWRPIEGDVILLGRAKGCDIGLVSPEVAPVHCAILRTLNGWRIRDCSGRSTRINGKSIQDEPLHNGDVLQIGTFSFEARLPALASVAGGLPSVEVARLQRSRRYLVELALSLRSRLRDQEADSREQAKELEQLRHDMEQLEHRLRAQPRKEPSAERPPSQPSMPSPEQMTQAQQLVQQAAERQAELDRYAAHLRRQAERFAAEKQQFAKQCEAERADFEADLVRQGIELKSQHEQLSQWQGNLARRHGELEKMAGELTDVLQRERDQLEADRTQLERDREQILRDQNHLQHLREEVERLRTSTPPPHRPMDSVTSREVSGEPQYNGQPDRLASARKLLQELAQKRKSTLKPHAPVPTALVAPTAETAH